METQGVVQGEVKLRSENKVASVTFSHPRGNSLPGKLLREIAKSIRTLGQDKNVNVIVLRSAGDKAFCAGASFDELLAIKTKAQGQEFFMGFADIILAIRDCPKFVVARVQGKTVGGGVGVVAACDYAFATEAAAIRLSEFALGFGPFVISAAVQRKVGLAAFGELAIGAEWRDASWATTHGLYQEVHATIAELDGAVEKFAGKLSTSNPEAIHKLKAVLWDGTAHWDKLLQERAAISSELVLTEFVQGEIGRVKGSL